MSLNFNKIEDGELLRWEKVGVKVVGVYISYREQNTANGIGHVYEMKTKDALVPFFAPTLLHRKLQGIATGNIVSIEFVEQTKTGAGNPLKHFDVGWVEPNEANLKAIGVELIHKVEDEEK